MEVIILDFNIFKINYYYFSNHIKKVRNTLIILEKL